MLTGVLLQMNQEFVAVANAAVKESVRPESGRRLSKKDKVVEDTTWWEQASVED